MLRVGLTGNVASGKSSVARVWRRRGAPVVEADELARRVVEPGRPALARIAEEFGPRVLDADGRLDRAALRAVVFADPEARRRLEAITHPAIAALREREEARLRWEGAPVVVHDIPLLFEVGLEDAVDLVVLVDAPAELRLARMVRDRGLGEGEARRIIEAQMPAARKRPRADLVIENTGTLAELETAAEEAWAEIEARASASG